MLSQLTIKNFGLIDQLSLDFDKRLNILTGETGAGKSIVIGALRSVLGEKMQAGQLRDPDKPCVIEAVFEINDKELRNNELFKEFIADDEPVLIIQRTLTPDAKNKIKINGSAVTLNQLRDLGGFLMDFHGPHDHQLLLSSESHIGILDRLIDFGKLSGLYRDQYRQYTDLKSQLRELHEHASSRERELDLLSHQVKELGQLPLEQDIYDEIKAEQARINNAEKIHENLSQVIDCLEAEDVGVSERVRKIFSPLRSLNQLDEQTSFLMDSLSQIQEQTDQLLTDLKEYANRLSFEPDEAQDINRRCDLYEDIMRKYGPSLDEAKVFYVQVKEKYELLSNFEKNDAELHQRIKDAEKQLVQTASEISKKRKKTSSDLKKTIENELKELGISHVQFDIVFEKGDFSVHGYDQVAFYISPNAGEKLKPLSDIVSSGEAARVMLALKKALINVDPIPTLIFDEIDAQIGGRLGTITGQKLKNISEIRQVILITHLPQIASFADKHFKVEKVVKDGRALTTLSLLNKDARIVELAHMMSGKEESKIALKHASDMLANASQ